MKRIPSFAKEYIARPMRFGFLPNLNAPVRRFKAPTLNHTRVRACQQNGGCGETKARAERVVLYKSLSIEGAG